MDPSYHEEPLNSSNFWNTEKGCWTFIILAACGIGVLIYILTIVLPKVNLKAEGGVIQETRDAKQGQVNRALDTGDKN